MSFYSSLNIHILIEWAFCLTMNRPWCGEIKKRNVELFQPSTFIHSSVCNAIIMIMYWDIWHNLSRSWEDDLTSHQISSISLAKVCAVHYRCFLDVLQGTLNKLHNFDQISGDRKGRRDWRILRAGGMEKRTLALLWHCYPWFSF